MQNFLRLRAILINNNICVRKAANGDIDTILYMIKALADFEGMASSLDRDILAKALENEFFAYIAFCGDKPVGSAVCRTYSTLMFGGIKTLYIEDLFVEENFRHMGVGTILFEKLKEAAKAENYSKIEWKCLPENKNALEFYKKTGGEIADGWLTLTFNKF